MGLIIKLTLLIWPRGGNIRRLKTWDEFIVVETLEGRLNLEDKLKDILTIFSYIQRKDILAKITIEKNSIPIRKQSVVTKHAEIVAPPAYSRVRDEQRVKFWTIEYHTGNLEEHLFTQKGAKLQVQSWLREKEFGIEFEGNFKYWNE